MSSDLLSQALSVFGSVAVGVISKNGNPKKCDEYSYPQIQKVWIKKGNYEVSKMR